MSDLMKLFDQLDAAMPSIIDRYVEFINMRLVVLPVGTADIWNTPAVDLAGLVKFAKLTKPEKFADLPTAITAMHTWAKEEYERISG